MFQDVSATYKGSSSAVSLSSAQSISMWTDEVPGSHGYVEEAYGSINSNSNSVTVTEDHYWPAASSGPVAELVGIEGGVHGGTQWLIGGSGDTLTGGSTADTFNFAPGFGKETINNFNTAQDVIDPPQSLFANFAAVEADMHASGLNTVITLDANDEITLSHVAVQNLHAQNFHFVV